MDKMVVFDDSFDIDSLHVLEIRDYDLYLFHSKIYIFTPLDKFIFSYFHAKMMTFSAKMDAITNQIHLQGTSCAVATWHNFSAGAQKRN